jgi:hypothetical protein
MRDLFHALQQRQARLLDTFQAMSRVVCRVGTNRIGFAS